MEKPKTFKDRSGQTLELLLYKRDTCPFCVRVTKRAKELKLDLPTRDTEQEPNARQELADKGGMTQVPCLFINGKALYESADIIRFLEQNVVLD